MLVSTFTFSSSDQQLSYRATLLLAAYFLLSQVNAAPEQSHRGVDALKAAEYDMWFGKTNKRQYLTGVWKLWRAKAENEPALAELKQKPFSWWYGKFAESAEKQLVPMDWHLIYPNDGKNPLTLLPETRAGIYGLSFDVPAEKHNKRAILHFDAVDSECQVYVNGHLVVEHKNFFAITRDVDTEKLEGFEVDVTKHLKKDGANELLVIVFSGPKSEVWGNVMVQAAGLTGPVWMDYEESTYIKELYLTPRLSSATLAVELLRDVAESAPESSEWLFKISPWSGKGRSYQQKQKLQWEKNQAKVELKMPNCIAWDTENPFLYKIEIFDSKDHLVKSERFGFREFKAGKSLFLLNNKSVWLRGYLWHSRPIDVFRTELNYNYKDWVKKYLRLLKQQGNVNHIRIHNGGQAKIFYSLCDELGLLVSEEFDIPKVLLKKDDPRIKADFIARNHVALLFDDKTNIKIGAVNLFAAMVKRTHNHPSVVMYNTGNERSPDKLFFKYAKSFYQTVHQTDRQDRPVASWGSGPHLELARESEDLPTDYFDFHNYDESLAGGYWDVAKNAQLKERDLSIERGDLNKDLPMIDGETVASMMRLEHLQKVHKLFTQGESEREVFLAWSRNDFRWSKYITWMSSIPLAQIGIRSYRNEEVLLSAHADYFRQMLETQRRELDFLQGIACLGITHDFLWQGSPSRSPRDPIKVEIATPLPYLQSLGRVYHPLWLSAASFSKNVSAGSLITVDAIAHNGTVKSYRDLKAQLLVQQRGEVIARSEALPLGEFTADERKKISFNLTLPANLPSGKASLSLNLIRSGEVIFSMPYQLQVIKPSQIKQGVLQNQLAVYDTAAGTSPLAYILKGAGIEAIITNDLSKALSASHIIIAANSLDENLEVQSQALRQWVEKGGKLLVLEQQYEGWVPFLSEYTYASITGRPYADILDRKHPALIDILPKSLKNWLGSEVLFDHCLHSDGSGVDESILVSAVSTPSPRHTVFGMAASEVKVGKGAIYFNQIKATHFYASDLGAKQYLDHVINYFMSDDFAQLAPAPSGTGKKIEYISPENIFFLPITKKANSRLHDEKANDGKGGWADLGRDNMHFLARKEHRFAGINYRIDKENKMNAWKNCIILGGSIRPRLPTEIKGISVGKKLTSIHFLQTAMEVKAKIGEKIGSYLVHYTDGSQVGIPLLNQVHLADWTFRSDLKEALRVKSVMSPAKKYFSLYTMSWTNPHPEKTIASIDMQSEGNAILSLLAASGVMDSEE